MVPEKFSLVGSAAASRQHSTLTELLSSESFFSGRESDLASRDAVHYDLAASLAGEALVSTSFL